MEIPKEILDLIREENIDVIDLVLNQVSRKDPGKSISIRVELARRFMNEALDYMNRGDAVQASEKAYKAAEEVVKALAEKFDLPEYREALGEGRWFTYLLGRAVNSLVGKLGSWVVEGWGCAYYLHVWGFHEAKLSVRDITAYVDCVRKMISEAERALTT